MESPDDETHTVLHEVLFLQCAIAWNRCNNRFCIRWFIFSISSVHSKILQPNRPICHIKRLWNPEWSLDMNVFMIWPWEHTVVGLVGNAFLRWVDERDWWFNWFQITLRIRESQVRIPVIHSPLKNVYSEILRPFSKPSHLFDWLFVSVLASFALDPYWSAQNTHLGGGVGSKSWWR